MQHVGGVRGGMGVSPYISGGFGGRCRPPRMHMTMFKVTIVGFWGAGGIGNLLNFKIQKCRPLKKYNMLDIEKWSAHHQSRKSDKVVKQTVLILIVQDESHHEKPQKGR